MCNSRIFYSFGSDSKSRTDMQRNELNRSNVKKINDPKLLLPRLQQMYYPVTTKYVDQYTCGEM